MNYFHSDTNPRDKKLVFSRRISSANNERQLSQPKQQSRERRKVPYFIGFMALLILSPRPGPERQIQSSSPKLQVVSDPALVSWSFRLSFFFLLVDSIKGIFGSRIPIVQVRFHFPALLFNFSMKVSVSVCPCIAAS